MMMKNKNVPKIRFKGFKEEWEAKLLNNLASFSKGSGYSKSDLCERGVPIILYGRLYTKYETTILNVDTFVKENVGSIISKGNEVIVPASGETAEDIARGSAIMQSGVILGGDLNIIYPNEEIYSIFLALSISNGQIWRELAKKAQGKSVVHLRNGDLQEVKLRYPKIDEQIQISTYFKKLDTLINKTQSKLDKLKNIKKACLEKMFPKKGVTIPEIRFKGFSGEWEENKIKEICSITTGKSNTQDQVDDGLYPFFIRSDKAVRSNRYLYDCEAVLTIGDGNIGKVFHYVNGKFDLHQRVYKMADFSDVVAKYFYYYFSTMFYDRAMKMTAKATVDSVRLDMISEMDIQKPISLEEQNKISKLFTQLDNLILKNERQLTKLKNIKKACLEKMFVNKEETI